MNNAIKWGGIMGVCLIAVNLILHFTGMSTQTSGIIVASLLNYVISIGAIIMGISALKKGNEGFLTLGNGVIQGLLIGLVGGLIMAIWTFVFNNYIAPDAMEIARAQSMEGMSEEQMEAMGGMMDAMTSGPILMGTTVFMKVCLGLLVGLIGGAIMKNERPITSDTL